MISQFDYTYNAAGSIQTWTQNHSGLANPRQYTFDYDGLDQLKAATLKNTVTSATLREQAYRYDAAGNRTTVQDGNMVATETPNELNQLMQVTGGGMMRFAGTLSEAANVTVGGNSATVRGDNSFEGFAQIAATGTTRVPIVATDIDSNVTSKYVDVTPDVVGAKAFTYDLNGNTLTSGPTGAPNATYGWDASDRLISVTQGSNVTTFEYDGLGRRVREKLNGTETRRWVWCGLELCEERDSSNTVTKRFYGQGEQIAGTAYFASRDHLGSIRELTDSTGTLRARYDYDLYGTRSANLVTANSVESSIGFTGHQEFEALGLVGAPYRFYQPSFGRWLSRDPIEEQGGINLYRYVNNNPSNYYDPLGLLLDGGALTIPSVTIGTGAGIGIAGGVMLFGAAIVGFGVGYGIGTGAVAVYDWLAPEISTPAVKAVMGPPRPPGCGPKAPAGAPDPGEDAYQRQKAVREAWKMEKELVNRTGQGTRPWTQTEKAELLSSGRVRGYVGHHINSVSANPQLAGNPSNIQFVRPSQHLGLHGGNYANPTWGSLITR